MEVFAFTDLPVTSDSSLYGMRAKKDTPENRAILVESAIRHLGSDCFYTFEKNSQGILILAPGPKLLLNKSKL